MVLEIGHAALHGPKASDQMVLVVERELKRGIAESVPRRHALECQSGKVEEGEAALRVALDREYCHTLEKEPRTSKNRSFGSLSIKMNVRPFN